MKDIDRFVSASAAKDQLLDLIRTVQRSDDVVAITKNGTPAAILLSVERFDDLIETIEVLSDAEAMRALRRSHRQARAGRWVTHTDLFGE